MRVLFLHDRLSARGGADRHLIGLLERLRGRVETLLAVGLDDASLPPAERAGLGPWRRVKGLDRGGLKPRGGRAARARLERLLDEFQPQVIHVHNLMDPDLLDLAASSGRGLMTVQDHRLFCPGRGQVTPGGRACNLVLGPACRGCFEEAEYGARLMELTRRRLEAASGLRRLLVLSSYMARQLIAAGAPAERVEVLPPFVSGLEFPPRTKPGSYHLLAGRLVERKGLRVALAAAGRLKEPLPLVVTGDGPLAGEAARSAQASAGRVRFFGWADRPAMARLLAGARSLWLPSLWAEPFGIVGLEALAAGTPVIAAAVGGVADWLGQGREGCLVPAGEAGALAEAADRLAAADELALGLGRAGQTRVSRDFEPERLMDRLLAVYRAAAAPRPVNEAGRPKA